MGATNLRLILRLESRKRKKLKRSSCKTKRTEQEDQNGVLNDDCSSTCSSTSSKFDCLNDNQQAELSSNLCRRNISNTKDKNTLSILAIDCEMVGVGEDKKSALARCSIVNYEGVVIYDTYVKPDDPITDFRTQWSGIRPKHMRKAISFRKAKKKAKRLVRNHILVGHSLQSDLNVLKLTHPPSLVRDTSKYVPLRVLAGLPSSVTPSLKTLTRNLLQTDIQTREHCSVEDAISSLNLYKLCENQWESEMEADGKNGSYLCDAYWPSWTNMNKKLLTIK